jgi:hypothetical protein
MIMDWCTMKLELCHYQRPLILLGYEAIDTTIYKCLYTNIDHGWEVLQRQQCGWSHNIHDQAVIFLVLWKRQMRKLRHGSKIVGRCNSSGRFGAEDRLAD